MNILSSILPGYPYLTVFHLVSLFSKISPRYVCLMMGSGKAVIHLSKTVCTAQAGGGG